jgi:hypothetical protein
MECQVNQKPIIVDLYGLAACLDDKTANVAENETEQFSC